MFIYSHCEKCRADSVLTHEEISHCFICEREQFKAMQQAMLDAFFTQAPGHTTVGSKEPNTEREAKCKYCGNDFKTIYRTKVFCNSICRDKFYKENNYTTREDEFAHCKYCEEIFKRKNCQHNFCSEYCRLNFIKPESKDPECKKCGTTFLKKYSGSKYCEKCREEKSVNKKKDPKLLTCVQCKCEYSQVFTRICDTVKVPLCSKDCKDRYRNIQKMKEWAAKNPEDKFDRTKHVRDHKIDAKLKWAATEHNDPVSKRFKACRG